MSVYHGYSALPEAARGAVAALGNFDGVHRGHQAVLSEAVTLARALGAPAGAAVFTPHPRRVFQPDAEPFALMSAAQRVRALQGAGAQLVHHIPFDRALAAMSPERFVREALHEGLGLAGVVTGADFCFGRNRAGDAQTLKALGEACGMAVRIAAPVKDGPGAQKISSSGVRQALREGDPARAATLLGRPFAIEGEVSEGDRRGRTIGFPTANVALGEYLRPAFGVYAVRVNLGGGEALPAVANIGRRPTVEGLEARLEAYLFDFNADLYGQMIECELIAFIRPEQRFDGLDALRAQIAADCDTARRLLGAGT
ncbi:bifunctional riboflavin kinase/FAD synthetase [Alkalicaulis satelles]|uniref:Riboflavin biosynthesis protein n=1 Tax=Alkalicaulis satelles TaxID=2609175 RepID=A0A5M6ZH57_9PROT|nr:bifunctional riboflavin kinase/FAD synthetase [Alkalicaulis satelles]KAA5803650.1 bifunctional riboflavin kinase/FAD synthetase [Alkalicaulis satelles]